MTDGPDHERLFLAVALDDEVRAGLRAHLVDNGGDLIPGRHVTPANWHITLRFLGRSAPVQRDRVMGYLDGELGGGSFPMRFGGLGAFPRPPKATVVWLAVTEGAERLVDIAATCEEAAQVAGFFPEERPFHPHLTLSRVRPPEDVGVLTGGFSPYQGRLLVDRVTLFESILGRGPARYSVIEEFRL